MFITNFECKFVILRTDLITKYPSDCQYFVRKSLNVFMFHFAFNQCFILLFLLRCLPSPITSMSLFQVCFRPSGFVKDAWDRGEWVRHAVLTLLLSFSSFILLLFNTSPAPPANKRHAAGKLCQGWIQKNGVVSDAHT